jgi:hypothetical protein
MGERLGIKEKYKRKDEEQLIYNLNGRFHKYSDITSSEAMVLQPGRNAVWVHITPDNLIDLTDIRNPKYILKGRQRYSMRSRFAQVGIEPDPDMGFDIASALSPDSRDSFTGKVIKPFDAEVHLMNHARRSVFIPEGTGLFRGFCGFPNNRVTGDELIQLVRDDKLAVEGQYGTHWDYIRQAGTNNVIGMRVRIQEDMFWIPPSKDTDPIRISPNGPGYRDEIRKHLDPAPLDLHPRLLIAETMPMKIPTSVEAIIATNINTEALESNWTIADLGKRKDAQHINSHLIDGGSHWVENGVERGIILEIRGIGHPIASPKVVDFYFARAAA